MGRRRKKLHKSEPNDEERPDDAASMHEDSAGAHSAGQDSSATEQERLRAERNALEEKLKRTLADIANMRRRQAEDMRRVADNSIGRIAQEMLPIMDSFELALTATGDRDALLEGVRMVHSMLEDLLGRHGVEPIQAADRPFDPQLHEALAVEQRDDVPPGTVVTVHQSGFSLGDRVLRPARVVVSQAPSQQPGESAESQEDSDAQADVEPEGDSQSGS